ncbi:MAG: septum formation inhibitor Maf [Betaproteobacteria bacterium HGW-Betaproteobacteria-11]|nr:MAG: septum formation inhibitor Maf [Betaproteobacteria bacterium HGW-Betaproteobacteria-11]
MIRRLVLASTSPFRRELLGRLQLPFETAVPAVDERPLDGEAPATTAIRLAQAKAVAVAARFPQALVIGSDQVAACGEQRFGKPGNRNAAVNQLQSMRGREIIFHTGVCLLDSASGRLQSACIPTQVGIRGLTDDEIFAYLDKEDALGCAGSAKSEGLGIALMRYLRGDDPTALVGLPLIALCEMLRVEGIALP